MYLVTGGTGGMAEHVTAMLSERFGVHLLLAGRREGDAQTKALVQRLQTGTTNAAYEQADVCDEARLQHLVTDYEVRWHRRLEGVLHFAGVYHECPTVEEEPGRFLELLRPKTTGTIVLHRLLASRGGGLFVASSSVMGLFGGATTAAYATANAFQHAFAEEYDGRDGVRHVCLAWSSWDGVGQRRGWQLSDAARARGYFAISAERGVQSFVMGIGAQLPVVLIGIDGSQPAMRPLVEHGGSPIRKVSVFYNGSGSMRWSSLQAPHDRFGVPASAEFVRVAVMPRHPDGTIAVERLMDDGGSGARRRREPDTVVERELAQLWKSMLAIPAVGLDDSFFSLGGDSLQAVRMLGRLREMFGVELPLRAIFDADDLRALATAIDEAQKRTAVSSGMAPQGASDLTTPLLDRLDDLSEAEIDALLQQLEGQER
jgi:NAD(P)-dependent dehydrogenase (short-subunit alcohol dehydrogenase family)/acyl carrier protein